MALPTRGQKCLVSELFQFLSRTFDLGHPVLKPSSSKKNKTVKKGTYLAGSFFLGAMIFLASRILFQCFLPLFAVYFELLLLFYNTSENKTQSRGGAAVTSKNHMLLLSTLGAELQNSCENAAFSL